MSHPEPREGRDPNQVSDEDRDSMAVGGPTYSDRDQQLAQRSRWREGHHGGDGPTRDVARPDPAPDDEAGG